jgi:lycopene elongase/hydratase (dihydrobisanhydrobacterioruberin-forming)
MQLIQSTVKLSRPRFWLYLAGPALLGFAFSEAAIKTDTIIKILYILAVFLIPANIFLYGVNDIFDRFTDEINPKKIKKETKYNETTKKSYLASIWLSGLFLASLFFIFQNIYAKWFFVFFLILSFCYSAPPLRFKGRPFLDSASNVLYALPGFMLYTEFSGSLSPSWVIIASWLWTAAMHLFSAIPDIAVDKKAGIMTGAVFIGERTSLFFCMLLWLGFAYVVTNHSPLFFLSFLYPLIPVYMLYKPQDISRVYWKFPYLTSTLGFLTFLYAVLQ